MTQIRRHIFAMFTLVYGIAGSQQAHAIHPKQLVELYTWPAILFIIGQYRIEQEIRQHTKPVHPEVEQFIRAECKRIGLPEWQTVRIVQHPHRSMSTIDTLCLEKNLVNQIIQTGDRHHEARAVIHHEAGHIKHRHIVAKFAFNPFLSMASTYCTFILLNRRYPLSYYTLLALEFGLYYYIISPFFSRICEWDADECIANDPRTLAGGIRYFAMLQQHENAFFNDLVQKAPVGGRLDRWSHNCELISTHPSTEKRIKRLQQRLAKHPDKHLLSQQELAYLLDPRLASGSYA